MNEISSYRCACCGEVHEGLPDVGFAEPYHYASLSDEERSTSHLSSDFCTIDDEHFFVRACLPVPLKGQKEEFVWGVWVSLSRSNYQRYREIFEEPEPNEGPYFGWLCSRIPGYPDTLHLKTRVHLEPYPTRPRVELEPTDHPLAVEQRDGIELDRLMELLHDQGVI